MALQMDPGEILRDYNAAAGKDKQIQILAELNCCRPLEIALCLREQGAALTGTWKARLAAHDRASMRMELPKDGEEPIVFKATPVYGDDSEQCSVLQARKVPKSDGPDAVPTDGIDSAARGPHPAPSGPPSPCEGKAENGWPGHGLDAAPTEGAGKANAEHLTAGALQELLSAVPGDTPVQICGHPGQATAALFIMRADSRGTGFVLRIQREE